MPFFDFFSRRCCGLEGQSLSPTSSFDPQEFRCAYEPASSSSQGPVAPVMRPPVVAVPALPPKIDAQTPLGPIEPLRTMQEEFKCNASLCEKIGKLGSFGYIGWRRVRGDGNCFYRAAGFAVYEGLMRLSKKHREHWVKLLLEKFGALQFTDAAEAKGHMELLECTRRLLHGEHWMPVGGHHDETDEEALYRTMCSRKKGAASLDLPLVRAFRHVMSQFLQDHHAESLVQGGIELDTLCVAEGYEGAAQYAKQVLEEMGEEAESLCIAAFAHAFDIGLRVMIIDRTPNVPLHNVDYNFPPLAAGSGNPDSAGKVGRYERPVIHVQLRPGHYDVIVHPGFGSDPYLEAEEDEDEEEATTEEAGGAADSAGCFGKRPPCLSRSASSMGYTWHQQNAKEEDCKRLQRKLVCGESCC